MMQKPLNTRAMCIALRHALCTSALAIALPFTTAATEVEGGGTAATDCWVTFDSIPAVNVPGSRPHSIRCADQDATCGDADTRVGYCGYAVNLILNSSHFNPPCTPSDLSSDHFLIPYTEPENDDHPLHVDDLQPFQTFVANSGLSQTATQVDVASGFNPVHIPLGIRFTSKGPFFRRTTLTMRTTMCTVALKGETFCPTKPLDTDKFKLTCGPPVDPMTGAPISACIGADGNPLSGTFQQIQEHVFDRKCSNVSACHNPGPPNLCLRSDCGGGRAAYTDLVGQDPTNFAARNDGLKRVDADGISSGNAANSLLLHKLDGGHQLNSQAGVAGAYGLRMPYNNPAIGKKRAKLSHAEIQLIADWITAGAPATGFVPTTAVGACH